MSYESVRAALLSELQAVAGFDDTMVKSHNYNVLNAGFDHCIVLGFYQFNQVPTDLGGGYQMTWTIYANLYEKANPDFTTADIRFATDIALIQDRLNTHWRMGLFASGINAMWLRQGQDTSETIEIAGARYIKYQLTVDVEEDTSVDLVG